MNIVEYLCVLDDLVQGNTLMCVHKSNNFRWPWCFTVGKEYEIIRYDLHKNFTNQYAHRIVLVEDDGKKAIWNFINLIDDNIAFICVDRIPPIELFKLRLMI